MLAPTSIASFYLSSSKNNKNPTFTGTFSPCIYIAGAIISCLEVGSVSAWHGHQRYGNTVHQAQSAGRGGGWPWLAWLHHRCFTQQIRFPELNLANHVSEWLNITTYVKEKIFGQISTSPYYSFCTLFHICKNVCGGDGGVREMFYI